MAKRTRVGFWKEPNYVSFLADRKKKKGGKEMKSKSEIKAQIKSLTLKVLKNKTSSEREESNTIGWTEALEWVLK